MFVLGRSVMLQYQDSPEDEAFAFPEDRVLVYDPSGRILRKNRVLISPYRPLTSREVYDEQSLNMSKDFAQNFLGSNTRLLRGTIDVPDGRWDRVGNAVAVYYRRRGKLRGMQEHRFERPIAVWRHERGRVYELRLPRGSVIGEEGFVWP